MPRPKGKISDFLDLSASEITNLTESDLRGIIRKLNDASNKRLKRLKKSGFDMISPASKSLNDDKFKMPTKGEEQRDYINDLKTAYKRARDFLKADTSTIKGSRQYAMKFDEILGHPLEDPESYDKRYKKSKVLKKSVKKKLRDFWEKYDSWREIEKRNNPSRAEITTNLTDVAKFEEEMYSKGKTTLKDYEDESRREYEQSQEDESDTISPDEPNGQREDVTKQNEPKRKRRKTKGKIIKQGSVRVRFEKVSIFDEE